MEIKLNVYTNRKLKEIEKTYSVTDFKLALGAIEDVLNIVNVDVFEGGLEALSDESQFVIFLQTAVGGISVFKDVLKDIFDGLDDNELSRCDSSEIVHCIYLIINYAIDGLFSSFQEKN